MGIYRRGRPHKYNAITGAGVEPPRVVGEYRIRTKLHIIKYIGITNDLQRRMNEHIRSGKINEDAPWFEWMAAKTDSPYKSVRDHEGRKIRKHNPELNRNKGRGGREPKSFLYQTYGSFSKMLEKTNVIPDYCVEIDDGRGNSSWGVDGSRKRSAVFFFSLTRIASFLLKCILLVIILYLIYACFVNKQSLQEAVMNALSVMRAI